MSSDGKFTEKKLRENEIEFKQICSNYHQDEQFSILKFTEKPTFLTETKKVSPRVPPIRLNPVSDTFQVAPSQGREQNQPEEVSNEQSKFNNKFTQKFDVQEVSVFISLGSPVQTGPYVRNMAYLLAGSDRIKKARFWLADDPKWIHFSRILFLACIWAHINFPPSRFDEKKFSETLNKLLDCEYEPGNPLFSENVRSIFLEEAKICFQNFECFKDLSQEELINFLKKSCKKIILVLREEWVKQNKEAIRILEKSGKWDGNLKSWNENGNNFGDDNWVEAEKLVNSWMEEIKNTKSRFKKNIEAIADKHLKNFDDFPGLILTKPEKEFCKYLMELYAVNESIYLEAYRLYLAKQPDSGVSRAYIAYPGQQPSFFQQILNRKGVIKILIYLDTTPYLKELKEEKISTEQPPEDQMNIEEKMMLEEFKRIPKHRQHCFLSQLMKNYNNDSEQPTQSRGSPYMIKQFS